MVTGCCRPGTWSDSASRVASQGRGLEGRAHGDRLEPRPSGSEPLDHREGQIGVQVSLVDLVEDDRIDPSEFGVVDEPANEDALGAEDEASGLRGPIVEADLVADFSADLLTPLAGHLSGGETGGHPPRLQHQDLARVGVQQEGRNPAGLPGPGLCHDHRGTALLQGFADRIQMGIDREARDHEP